MPEIKHNFTAGKMNKDLDERLVPSGEYRHAENVQVRTTDSSNAGTVQNIKGNVSTGSVYNTNYNDGVGSTHGTNAVGSIPDEKTDNIYFMFA